MKNVVFSFWERAQLRPFLLKNVKSKGGKTDEK